MIFNNKKNITLLNYFILSNQPKKQQYSKFKQKHELTMFGDNYFFNFEPQTIGNGSLLHGVTFAQSSHKHKAINFHGDSFAWRVTFAYRVIFSRRNFCTATFLHVDNFIR